MMSSAEMREIMDAGLHNDTYHAKQDAARARKHGWKVWAIDQSTYAPYIAETGFETRDEAVEVASRYEGGAFVKEASESDPDYFDSGESGWWRGLSDDEYERYSDALDNGSLY